MGLGYPATRLEDIPRRYEKPVSLQILGNISAAPPWSRPSET
jgi:hypothetical protein